ncbi:MAG: Uma2 family endonuclease [Polyangiales bacterium]
MSGDAASRIDAEAPAGWVLDDDEERMPESPLQTKICDLLKLILEHWCARRGADALVGGNIALRWDKAHPRHGVDPDVYLVEPAPPMRLSEKSIRTWVKGHHPPRVAVEVVSDGTASVDYEDKPERYARSKTKEVWVFDPEMLGPGGGGRAFRLQVWRRGARGGFRRVYAGDGPARSEELGAWLVVTDDGTRLRISDDAEGTQLWPTEAEAERAEKDDALARERAALDEIERLRAELARRG